MLSNTSEHIIIVGAGIAGLRTALNLKEKYPHYKITILEKYTQPGGRMETIFINKNTHYESGAGRIHSSHKTLLKLIKKYHLTTSKLPDESYWKTPETPLQNNGFFAIWKELCTLFSQLPEQTLRTHTLRYLTIEVLGAEMAKKLLDTYPYRAEIEIMSARPALDMFEQLTGGHFCVLNEGFTKLIEHLTGDAKRAGIKFHFNQDINRVEYNNSTELYKISGISNGNLVTYSAGRVILAVHKNALEKIYPFSPTDTLLQKIRMEPLLRIYSKYKDSSWFPDKNVITDTPLRFVIPINKEKGIIMSSYLDSRDIDPWGDLYKKSHGEKLKEKIHNETQNLFPETFIHMSEYTKAYYWKDGCSYWLPGNYDYKLVSKDSHNPKPEIFPRLHLVGESFSTKQQWIEGALEHADMLVEGI
jgi:monoamine oxidase